MDATAARFGSAASRRVAAMTALLTARPLLLDTAVALGLTLLSVVTVLGGATDIGSAIGGIGFVFLLLETLPLAVRRIWPVPVWVVTLAATVGHFLVSSGSPSTIRATLGALIALFTVSDRYERRRSVWAFLITFFLVAAIIVYRTGFPAGLGGLVQISVAVTVPWILGTWSRERRSFAALAEARAVAAEEQRDEEARRAVAEERDRIARELHDIVAHNLSVIVVQATAGVRAFSTQPGRSLETLQAIDVTAREALGEMRRMLSLLGPKESGDDPAPLPGLANLQGLVDRVRGAGLDVDVTIVGDVRMINPAVDLSVYRIIQEALTNSIRHSGSKQAEIRVVYTPAAIAIEVVDQGSRATSGEPIEMPHHGRGLVGMRERVNLFGGEFDAGPRPDGGFRVAARIPIPT